jgi:hypothetical protein
MKDGVGVASAGIGAGGASCSVVRPAGSARILSPIGIHNRRLHMRDGGPSGVSESRGILGNLGGFDSDPWAKPI